MDKITSDNYVVLDDIHRQEQIKKLKTTLKNLDEILAKLIDKDETERKHEIMELLHKYNDMKDAAQNVIGALANIERVTVTEIHNKLNLPLD